MFCLPRNGDMGPDSSHYEHQRSDDSENPTHMPRDAFTHPYPTTLQYAPCQGLFKVSADVTRLYTGAHHIRRIPRPKWAVRLSQQDQYKDESLTVTGWPAQLCPARSARKPSHLQEPSKCSLVSTTVVHRVNEPSAHHKKKSVL